MSDWKMQREEVFKLISLYKNNKCLWDYRSSDYKRTDLKKEAWQKLSNIFKRDVAEIKKKMKHLRSSYVNEKKKVDEYFAELPSYRPSLFYYEAMNFLDSIIVLRKTLSFEKYEHKDPIGDCKEEFVERTFSEHISEESESPPLSPQRPPETQEKSNKRLHKLAPYYSQLNDVVNSLAKVSNTPDEDSVYTAFGKTIALQLSQLTALEATITMSEIHQVLSKNIIQSMKSKARETSLNKTNESSVNRTRKRKLSNDEFL